MREVTTLFGAPGTGKTTELLGRVEQALSSGTRPEEIAFVSFTRKAADEAAQRAMDQFNLSRDQLPNFRTLHSTAYRMAGLTPERVMGKADWTALGKICGLDLSSNWSRSTEYLDKLGGTLADQLMQIYALSRARKRSVTQEYDEGRWVDVPLWAAEEFEQKLTAYKRHWHKLDFTDFLDQPVLPPNLDMLIVDEAQDLTEQQWDFARKLGRNAKKVIIGGDDDQCHPPGVMVQTPTGPVAVEHLQPRQEVIAYDQAGSRAVGLRGGQWATVATHHYADELVTLSTDNGPSCTYTKGHKCLVRWKPGMDKTVRAVYLMNRGRDWRVGQCQLVRADGVNHLWVRAKMEKAEKAWILKVVHSQADAYAWETIFAARYGIPQSTFQESFGSPEHLNQATLDRIFAEVDGLPGAMRALADSGLDIRAPIYDEEQMRSRRGGTSTFTVDACNVFDEVMLIPLLSGKLAKWVPFKKTRHYYEGPVYGLNVEKHHTYVANGIITHNCIYDWSGSSGTAMSRFRSNRVILPHSHRLPKSIFNLADSLIRGVSTRVAKVWTPRDEEGAVDYLPYLEDADLNSGKWLCVARHRRGLDAIEQLCRQRGYVYQREKEWSNQDPAVKAARAYETMRSGGTVTITDARLVASWVIDMPRPLSGENIGWGDLQWVGPAKARVPWMDGLTRLGYEDVSYIRSLRERGESLSAPGRITLSTIHGAKGGEEDNVLLLTGSNKRVRETMELDPDSELRVLYVGITRARHRLVVVGDDPRLRMF